MITGVAFSPSSNNALTAPATPPVTAKFLASAEDSTANSEPSQVSTLISLAINHAPSSS